MKIGDQQQLDDENRFSNLILRIDQLSDLSIRQKISKIINSRKQILKYDSKDKYFLALKEPLELITNNPLTPEIIDFCFARFRSAIQFKFEHLQTSDNVSNQELYKEIYQKIHHLFSYNSPISQYLKHYAIDNSNSCRDIILEIFSIFLNNDASLVPIILDSLPQEINVDLACLKGTLNRLQEINIETSNIETSCTQGEFDFYKIFKQLVYYKYTNQLTHNVIAGNHVHIAPYLKYLLMIEPESNQDLIAAAEIDRDFQLRFCQNFCDDFRQELKKLVSSKIKFGFKSEITQLRQKYPHKFYDHDDSQLEFDETHEFSFTDDQGRIDEFGKMIYDITTKYHNIKLQEIIKEITVGGKQYQILDVKQIDFKCQNSEESINTDNLEYYQQLIYSSFSLTTKNNEESQPQYNLDDLHGERNYTKLLHDLLGQDDEKFILAIDFLIPLLNRYYREENSYFMLFNELIKEYLKITNHAEFFQNQIISLGHVKQFCDSLFSRFNDSITEIYDGKINQIKLKLEHHIRFLEQLGINHFEDDNQFLLVYLGASNEDFLNLFNTNSTQTNELHLRTLINQVIHHSDQAYLSKICYLLAQRSENIIYLFNQSVTNTLSSIIDTNTQGSESRYDMFIFSIRYYTDSLIELIRNKKFDQAKEVFDSCLPIFSKFDIQINCNTTISQRVLEDAIDRDDPDDINFVLDYIFDSTEIDSVTIAAGDYNYNIKDYVMMANKQKALEFFIKQGYILANGYDKRIIIQSLRNRSHDSLKIYFKKILDENDYDNAILIIQNIVAEFTNINAALLKYLHNDLEIPIKDLIRDNDHPRIGGCILYSFISNNNISLFNTIIQLQEQDLIKSGIELGQDVNLIARAIHRVKKGKFSDKGFYEDVKYLANIYQGSDQQYQIEFFPSFIGYNNIQDHFSVIAALIREGSGTDIVGKYVDALRLSFMDNLLFVNQDFQQKQKVANSIFRILEKVFYSPFRQVYYQEVIMRIFDFFDPETRLEILHTNFNNIGRKYKSIASFINDRAQYYRDIIDLFSTNPQDNDKAIIDLSAQNDIGNYIHNLISSNQDDFKNICQSIENLARTKERILYNSNKKNKDGKTPILMILDILDQESENIKEDNISHFINLLYNFMVGDSMFVRDDSDLDYNILLKTSKLLDAATVHYSTVFYEKALTSSFLYQIKHKDHNGQSNSYFSPLITKYLIQDETSFFKEAIFKDFKETFFDDINKLIENLRNEVGKCDAMQILDEVNQLVEKNKEIISCFDEHRKEELIEDICKILDQYSNDHFNIKTSEQIEQYDKKIHEIILNIASFNYSLESKLEDTLETFQQGENDIPNSTTQNNPRAQEAETRHIHHRGKNER